MSKPTNKRFSDWTDCTEVDCNECELWWLNQCDGVQKAQERRCTAFKATRSVVIPQEMKWLRTRLKRLTVALWFLGVSYVITTIIILFFGG